MNFLSKLKSFLDLKVGIIIFLIAVILMNRLLLTRILTTLPLSVEIPAYQFGMILKNSEDPYWQDFKRGAERAAVFYHSSLYTQALNEMDASSVSDALSVFDRLSYSGLDGIVSYVDHTKDYSTLVDETVNRGMPVITLENDVANSMRHAFVGFNAYKYGAVAGEKMVEALNGVGKVVIVMNTSEKDAKNVQNLKVSGFLSVINQNRGIEIVDSIVSDEGVYGTQEMIQKLVNANANVDGIYITNSDDTKSVAELLVESNLVGRYKIIGSGISEDIRRYVDKHILQASIYVDGYDMGYRSIETLARIKNGEAMPSYIESDIGVLTATEGKR